MAKTTKKHKQIGIQGHRDFSPDLNKTESLKVGERIKNIPRLMLKKEY
jgi:hypothetical protein